MVKKGWNLHSTLGAQNTVWRVVLKKLVNITMKLWSIDA
jgi:hypothetical protein